MESVEKIADYFIWLGMSNEMKPVTNKKLQKLVYYAQAWSLALDGRPLFSEQIEAWIHGPSVPVLYRKFKKFGFNPIHLQEINSDFSQLLCRELLDEIWEVYGKYDADYLELLTHREEPWIKARNHLEIDQSSSSPISLEDMREFYSRLLQEEE